MSGSLVTKKNYSTFKRPVISKFSSIFLVFTIDFSVVVDNFTDINYIRIHPNFLSFHKERIWDKPRSRMKKESLANLERNIHHNRMSPSTTSKCKRAINYLLLNSTNKRNPTRINWKDTQFRMAFITLTLSAKQMHSDNEIKRQMLNPFLIELKRQYGIKNYVWRSERQQNGNVHFHILVDKFIPWHEIRGLWNHQQAKLGYITQYAQSMLKLHSSGFKVRSDLLDKWPLKSQLKAYHEGKARGWRNPNSTDIHSVRYISNVAAYVTKYMTKEQSKRTQKVRAIDIEFCRKSRIELHSVSQGAAKFLREQAQIGRLWGCSYQLTNITGGESVIDSTLNEEINRLSSKPGVIAYNDGYVHILCCTIQDAIDLHCINIVTLLSEFMCERFVLSP